MIDDTEFAKILRRYFEKDFETRNSWLVWKRKEALATKLMMEPMELINTTGRTLTTLDLWPYQNCSCYILKKGAEPVPAISEKEMLSRLLKATGRFVQPIM